MSVNLSFQRYTRRLMLSIALATLGYIAFALWAGWREVAGAFIAVGASGITIALLFTLASYVIRFTRWQMYLRTLGLSLATAPSMQIYLTGFALTTTPGKAGEMLRGVFLKRHGLSYSRSVAAFVSERLSDLVAIVLLTLPGLSQLPQGKAVVLAGIAAVALVLILLVSGGQVSPLAGRRPGGTGRLAQITQHVLAMLGEARACHAPQLLFAATALSIAAWSAEAYSFYLILHWLGSDTGLAFAFSVYALAILVGALSFLPGGLGGTEAVMTGLLIWAGMGEASAVAATIIFRLITLWFAVALGVVSLLMGNVPDADPATRPGQ